MIITFLLPAMMNAGVAAMQMNKLLAGVEIPPLHSGLIKRRQDEISPIINEVAKESCERALKEEIEATHKSNDEELDFDSLLEYLSDAAKEIAKITVSYDMGWQKRGTGLAYNSLSGFGSVVGLYTQKVLNFGLRQKDCRICVMNERKGAIIPQHDCVRNWTGSSKAMEADLASELILEIDGKECEVSTLIMDEDSTTISRLRRDIGHALNKLSDY